MNDMDSVTLFGVGHPLISFIFSEPNDIPSSKIMCPNNESTSDIMTTCSVWHRNNSPSILVAPSLSVSHSLPLSLRR
jgi:hypothetical protein